MRTAALTAVLGAVLLTIAACGDGESGEPGTDTATPSVTLTGERAELHDLLDGIESRTFRVVLERTSPPEMAGDRLQVLNSPQGARVDTIPAGSAEAASSLIGGADASAAVISCEDGPDNWRCFEVESFGPSVLRAAMPFTFYPTWELATYAITESEGRTVAGEPARCFRIQPPDEDEIEYCFTTDGVPVYSSPTFGTYEAVEISGEVPDDTFAPQAPLE